jgi:hypothetical protein
VGAVAGVAWFSSRGWLVVLAEFAAIGAGSFALSRVGWSTYIPPWVAFVVGAHFLGFGRFFSARFYVVAGALIAAGVIGTIVGLAGGGCAAVSATTGFLAAVSVFAASARIFAPGDRTTAKTSATR